MKTHFTSRSSGVLGLPSSHVATGVEVKRQTTVILGTMAEPLLTSLTNHFAKLGWRVKVAKTNDEVRRLATGCRAEAVILPVDSFAESGFLACAKLVLGLSKTRVVLVGEDNEENERFALFAGAAGYATLQTPAVEIARIVLGRKVASPANDA